MRLNTIYESNLKKENREEDEKSVEKDNESSSLLH